MRGTASTACGLPPKRARACAVPGECWSAPRSAWRELFTLRNTVSALRGTLTCLTMSGGSTPRAYHPIALGPFTMNMAARSTYWATSFTRWVRTSERLVPLSTVARDALSRSNPGPAAAAGGGGMLATTSAMAISMSASLIFSS